jgi:hypothetical protein
MSHGCYLPSTNSALIFENGLIARMSERTLPSFSAGANAAPPPHLGQRFSRDGYFLPEPGNTVVCHLVDGSPAQAAMIAVRERMMAMPEADRLLFTPISSLHMTLFQGIIEYRRKLPYWPETMPLDTAIEAMTVHYQTRLQGFEARSPFKVRVTALDPTGFTVVGATEADEHALRDWREALAEIFGYRHPDHEDYRFHITLAYVMDWLPDHAIPAWDGLLKDCLQTVIRHAPDFDLQPPAFCSFADMNHFEELTVLA